MRIIDKVSQALQRLLGPLAEEAAQSSNVILRKRKFSAMSLARTFILGFLAKPDASDEDLAQIAVQGGVEVTPQAIEQRYTPRMEQFLHELFCQATKMVVGSDKALAPILERFTEVTILDSSIITLPEDKKDSYRGCGGKHEGGEAAMKLQVELDLRSGALTHVQIEPGRSPDGATSRQQARRGKGSLRIADLGYFNLAVFEEMSKEGAYYLSRLQNPIVLRDLAGTVVDLAQWLPQQTGCFLDQRMLVGKTQRLPSRVIAWRLPAEQVARRRQKLRHDYKSKYGKEPSAERLELCAWTILITNVPSALMSTEEAIILYRARWQIELLFKRWKSQGLVALLQGSTSVRQMVRLWSRLLAAVVQHWLLIATAWGDPTKSLSKVCRVIATFATRLAAALSHGAEVKEVLMAIGIVVAKTCRRNKRTKPGTFELLNDVKLLGYA